MAGGRRRASTNHLYRSSKPDGLTIGNMSSGMVSLAILGESGVLYDIDKFIYLGSPYSQYHALFLSRKEAGFSSIAKLQAATGVRIGAQSVGFSTYNEGRLFAYLLRMKEPKFIPSYSGAELDPALMRGEVDARATGADSIVQRNPAADPSPLMPEAHEKTIREIPRDAETIELVKQIVGAGPLPQH